MLIEPAAFVDEILVEVGDQQGSTVSFRLPFPFDWVYRVSELFPSDRTFIFQNLSDTDRDFLDRRGGTLLATLTSSSESLKNCINEIYAQCFSGGETREIEMSHTIKASAGSKKDASSQFPTSQKVSRQNIPERVKRSLSLAAFA